MVASIFDTIQRNGWWIMRTTAFRVSVLVYVAVSLLIFGSIFTPIDVLIFPSNRLGASLWPLMCALGIITAAYIAFRTTFPAQLVSWRAPVFIVIAMFLSVGLVAAYAEMLRYWRVQEFAPDSYIGSSFFQSLRQAPTEFQFFLHAAALKGCKPYAWSYREMAFYELEPDVAVNVLPGEWLQRCAIKRTHE